MEGGHAEVAGELGGVVFEAGEELGDGKFDERDAVEHLAEPDVDEDEGELERIGEGFEKVKDGLIEFEQVTKDQADDRGAAHDGKNAECDTQGNTP